MTQKKPKPKHPTDLHTEKVVEQAETYTAVLVNGRSGRVRVDVQVSLYPSRMAALAAAFDEAERLTREQAVGGRSALVYAVSKGGVQAVHVPRAMDPR